MRNKVKKLNNFENYHYEKYEEIFGHFPLKKQSGYFSCFFEQIFDMLF